MTRYSPLWMQDDTYPAQVDRQLFDAIWRSGGVVGKTDWTVTQRGAGANMSVDVSLGKGVIPGNEVAGQGKYLCWSDGVENVTISAAPGVGLSRYSLVVATVRDADAIGGVNNDFIFQEVAGTAAASPVVPASPASSIVIARILVPHGMSAVHNADITDRRSFADTLGTLANVGDLLVMGPSGLDNLTVGSDGQVLTADSTAGDGVSWQGLDYSDMSSDLSQHTITSGGGDVTTTGSAAYTTTRAGKYQVNASIDLAGTASDAYAQLDLMVGGSSKDLDVVQLDGLGGGRLRIGRGLVIGSGVVVALRYRNGGAHSITFAVANVHFDITYLGV